MTREDWIRQEIEKYRRRIETYQSMIAEWESELGLNVKVAPVSQSSNGAAAKNDGKSDPLAAVPGMIFFGKSQPDACKLLLERIGYPLTTGQLATGIEKGGIKIGGKDEQAKKYNLYTILNRSPEFARVARDTWALAGWPGVVATKKAVRDAVIDSDKKVDESPA